MSDAILLVHTARLWGTPGPAHDSQASRACSDERNRPMNPSLKRASRGWLIPMLAGIAGGALLLLGSQIA
jgi:hypothetical protein